VLGFGQRKLGRESKERRGKGKGRGVPGDARRRRRPANGGRLAEPSPPGEKKGTREKKATGDFVCFLFVFFLKKKIFFVESVNEEKKSKIKPNWNGPKFMGRLKLSAKYNSPTSQPTISSKKKKKTSQPTRTLRIARFRSDGREKKIEHKIKTKLKPKQI